MFYREQSRWPTASVMEMTFQWSTYPDEGWNFGQEIIREDSRRRRRRRIRRYYDFHGKTSKITDWKFSNSWAKLEIIKTCNFLFTSEGWRVSEWNLALDGSAEKISWNFLSEKPEKLFFFCQKENTTKKNSLSTIEEFTLLRSHFNCFLRPRVNFFFPLKAF